MKSEKQMRKEAAKRLQRVQRDTRLILAAMRIEEEPGRYNAMPRYSLADFRYWVEAR